LEWFFHVRFRHAVAFSDEVRQEDIFFCESVQRGMR